MKMIMMTDIQEILYDKFKNLSPSAEGESFVVDTLDDQMPHRLGISSLGGPVLFVECVDNKMTTDINLKMFKVNFNRNCCLNDNEVIKNKKYCIIQLNSLNIDIQKYFLELTYLILKRLPRQPSVEALKLEISKIISLFTSSAQISKETIKGLWAELLVILQSNDCEYMIKSWHESPEDKYDFNDCNDKIEIKSTGNESRTHHFAIEQLQPNEGSNLLVASIVVLPSGLGLNVFDLVDKIASKITDTDLFLKLKAIVIETIGGHIEETKSAKYDFEYALSSIKWYNHTSIPCIKKEDIPDQLSRVSFSVCMKEVKEYNGDIKSILFENANIAHR